MRDSQRKRVYDAERTIPDFFEPELPEMHHLETFVAKARKNAFLLRRYEAELKREIYIGDGRARMSAGGTTGGFTCLA